MVMESYYCQVTTLGDLFTDTCLYTKQYNLILWEGNCRPSRQWDAVTRQTSMTSLLTAIPVSAQAKAHTKNETIFIFMWWPRISGQLKTLFVGWQEGHLARKNFCFTTPCDGGKCVWVLVRSTLWATSPVYFKKKSVKSFNHSHEDAQDKNDWRLRIKGATGSPRFTWKMAVKVVSVCVCVYKRARVTVRSTVWCIT